MEARRTFQQVGKTVEENWKRAAHEDAVKTQGEAGGLRGAVEGWPTEGIRLRL